MKVVRLAKGLILSFAIIISSVVLAGSAADDLPCGYARDRVRKDHYFFNITIGNENSKHLKAVENNDNIENARPVISELLSSISGDCPQNFGFLVAKPEYFSEGVYHWEKILGGGCNTEALIEALKRYEQRGLKFSVVGESQCGLHPVYSSRAE